MNCLYLEAWTWKIQDFNGIWAPYLATRVRRSSNQLSYEATDVGSLSFMCSAVQELNVTNVYEVNDIYKNCGN